VDILRETGFQTGTGVMIGLPFQTTGDLAQPGNRLHPGDGKHSFKLLTSTFLIKSPVPIKVQIGERATEGLGAGSHPEKGREAALENLQGFQKF